MSGGSGEVADAMGDIGSAGSGEFLSGLSELPLANGTSPHTPDESAANAGVDRISAALLISLGGWGGFAFTREGAGTRSTRSGNHYFPAAVSVATKTREPQNLSFEACRLQRRVGAAIG